MNFTEIADKFAIDGVAISANPLGNGLINDTLLITTDTGKGYVLQRINNAIFQDVDALQDNLLKITEHIRNKNANSTDYDRCTLAPVKTREGRNYLEQDGKYWRMTVLVPHAMSHETVNGQMAEATGEAFGKFHGYFTDDDAPRLKETIVGFHDLELRLDQLRMAIANDAAQRAESVKELSDYLLSRADELTTAQRLFREGKLKKRITHCDTKVNNILFDADDDRILCVIDLDTTMPGFVLADFGDFIRTAANKAAEDEPDTSKIDLDFDIFAAFARGYIRSSKNFLTPIEKSLLPYGAQMMTYMQAVRFLTDYINGDTYYKIAYPEHNRVRAIAQIEYLKRLDENLEKMNQYIASL